MERLIDVKAFRQSLEVDRFGCTDIVKVNIALDKSTVDAVEVVRCKDCKQWNCVTKPAFYDKRHGYCLNGDEPEGRWEDGFCSYGERKEE